MKILFISLGCDKNLVDSEVMLGLLTKHGYTLTDDETQADVIVINTCCFIHDAKEESINTILEMAQYKEQNLKALVVAGCLAERYKDEILKEIPEKVAYVITNEAGASVYSASKLATEEFPNFDVGQRSAASIARRVQDPLAELVKIDPKSIGVGQYQHDMNQKKLGEALGGVVEDCVNKVGVDLNTASASLLEYISGVSKVIAKNIVAVSRAEKSS